MNRKRWIRTVVVASYVLTVTYMAGKWAVHYAYLERGYDAIGGEYLFILMVAWAAGKLINLFLDMLEEERYGKTGGKQTGSGRTVGVRDNK